MPNTQYDPRYSYETCSKCGHRIQRIDYSGSLHQVTCGYPLPAPVEAAPSKPLTPEEWRAHDLHTGAYRPRATEIAGAVIKIREVGTHRATTESRSGRWTGAWWPATGRRCCPQECPEPTDAVRSSPSGGW